MSIYDTARRGRHGLMIRFRCGAVVALIAPFLCNAGSALAQNGVAAAPVDQGAGQEIVVTAQKRQQGVNSVPMSITAATGEALANLGIKDTGDLVKITSSLTFAKSQSGTPVYTLRGIGYEGTSIAARQAISLYMDEGPIPFAPQSRGAQLDLERVEVLKGPQGTLFGNNSTGGAINFVANKPTSTLKAGGTLTYGRFDQLDISGYVSGPITDTLSARVALEHQGGGDWQKSYTRDERNGRTDFTNGRVSLLWKPTGNLRALLTVNHWVDRSDFIYPQAIALVDPNGAFLPSTGLATYPFGARGNRYADWNPGRDTGKNNRFTSITGRIDYDLSDKVTLTSISSYIHYRQQMPTESDGVPTRSLDQDLTGRSDSFAQELRVAARLHRLNVMIGANYEHDLTVEDPFINLADSSVAYTFGALTGTPFNSARLLSRQLFKNYAVFGNAEYELADGLKIQGGIRYTQADVSYQGCTADTGDGSAAGAFSGFINMLRGGAGMALISIARNGCYTFNSATLTPGLVVSELNQNNVSWRAGINYQLDNRVLLYANISKGYKGGSYPLSSATTTAGLAPATQESVLTYEAGFKASLFSRALQFNAAAFYSDYRDKQIIGTVVDPVIGPINILVNVPKSRIYGVEWELRGSPVGGITLNLNGSYIRSDVLDHFIGVDNLGASRDFDGSNLPYVPHLQLNGGAHYQLETGGAINPFVSVNATHNSRANSAMGDLPTFTIKPYTLVDASAGVESDNGKWRAFVWGRNLFNTDYWSGTYRILDTFSRFTGMPATYGLTVSFAY